jgi:hypothetical protein
MQARGLGGHARRQGINRNIVINLDIIRRSLFFYHYYSNVKEPGLSYIRLNKHYIHLPYLYLGVVDALIVAGVAWGIQYLGVQASADEFDKTIRWMPIIILSLVLSCCTLH